MMTDKWFVTQPLLLFVYFLLLVEQWEFVQRSVCSEVFVECFRFL